MKRLGSPIRQSQQTLDSPLELSAKCRKVVADARRLSPDAFPRSPLNAGALAPAITLNTDRAFSLYKIAFTSAVADEAASSEAIVWVEGEDELLVRPGRVRIVFRDGFILVGIPVSSDQSGEVEVLVSFAVGRPGEPTGLVMAAEAIPRGPPAVVERWGDQLVTAAWSALLEMSARMTAAAGIDDQNQPLIPGAIVAHAKGIDITPQARHAINRKTA